jgi:hypothetical protein
VVALLVLVMLFRHAKRDAAVLALSVGGSAALNVGLSSSSMVHAPLSPGLWPPN